MLLNEQQLEEIREAYFKANPSYDAQTRTLMTSGIALIWLLGLPGNLPAPAIQVGLDLKAFNDIERLTDGTVPLELWLRNVISYFGMTPGGAKLKEYLSLVQRIANGMPTIATPIAGLPTITEAIIDRDETLPISFLAQGASVAASVVKLRVPQYRDSVAVEGSSGPVRYLGTGWLIAPDLLMTNHHVINARKDGETAASGDDLNAQAIHTTALFGYDDVTHEPSEVAIEKLEAWNSDLDFALLRLAHVPVGHKPLSLRMTPLNVLGLKDYFAVNIIQHPGGKSKCVALRSNLVYDAVFPKIRYFTDTEQGSSGSPVFDDTWRVVALHRAATAVNNVLFQGRSTGWVNEGVQINAILAYLHDHQKSLRDEISA
ncbi:MAG: hypothetical protein JWL77_3313 [Chthonomonadaceae bacterium]|nr:hypothetical protein [Chthonomonadaceae bacterium]